MTARNKNDLISQVNTLAADNSTGNISAADLRSLLTDLVDSTINNTESSAQNIASALDVDGALTKSDTAVLSGEGYTREGYADYNDSATAVTPITVPANTWVVLTNDGLGPFSRSTLQNKVGVSTIWDGFSQFDWSELSIDDEVEIRVDADVTTSGANADVEIKLFLGVGASEYSVPIDKGTFKAAGTNKMGDWQGIYLGDANTKDNPAELRIFSDVAATVVNNGFYAHVSRS